MWELNDLLLTEVINNAKDYYLKMMVQEGIITEEQKTQMHQYSIVIEQKGLLGRIYDSLFKKADDIFTTVVKVIREPKDETV